MEFPIAYILRHKKHGTYCRITSPTYCINMNILIRYENNKETVARFFTSNIENSKMWPTLKKLKKFLGEQAAQYYDVVGSDQTVIPATDLFK